MPDASPAETHATFFLLLGALSAYGGANLAPVVRANSPTATFDPS